MVWFYSCVVYYRYGIIKKNQLIRRKLMNIVSLHEQGIEASKSIKKVFRRLE